MAISGTRFNDFYRSVFVAEHRHRANIALHVFGTVTSGIWAVMSLLSPQPWWAVLYPLLHAAPGLLGHRLFERNLAIGDVRVTRSDYSPLWFIIANHRMTWDLLVSVLRKRSRL